MNTRYIISRLNLALFDINNALEALEANSEDGVYCNIDSAVDNLRDILCTCRDTF